VKRLVHLSLDLDVAEQLQTRAQEAGCTMAALVAYLIVNHSEDEGINALSKSIKSPKLVRAESAVLDCLGTFGGRCADLVAIAGRLGKPPREAYSALRALEREDLVKSWSSDELDRFGRPIESFWSLAGVHPDLGDTLRLVREMVTEKDLSMTDLAQIQGFFGRRLKVYAESVRLRGRSITLADHPEFVAYVVSQVESFLRMAAEGRGSGG
jgi:hypothetical protein